MVFFGPVSYNPGYTGTKTYKVNVGTPTSSPNQINATLLIRNGNGKDIVFEKCSKFQLSCLFKNFLLELELALLRPTSVSVTINNVSVFSKNDYDPKKGTFEKPFVALKNNLMEVKIKGSLFSTIAVSLRSSAVNLPPLADFTFNATEYIAPATVNFSGLLSRDQDSGYITSYKWNFGDGSVASGALVTHLYSLSGEYNVTLTVTDNLGASASKSGKVLIKANQPPIANFTLTLTTALGDFSATVDGAGSVDLDGKIVEHTVEWGDDSTPDKSDTPIKFSHIYQKSGNYKIVYRVKDDRGAIGSSEKLATLEDKTAPVLTINSPLGASNIRGNSISIAGLSNEKLTSAFAETDSQRIEFKISPDGFSFEANAIYQSEGNKSVKVYALDRSSNTGSITVNFTLIFNKPPASTFKVAGVPSLGQILEFDGSLSKDIDGSIVKYVWNFQDGTAQSETETPKINHTFASGGNYNVALTTIDNEGGSSTFINPIFINTPPVAEFKQNTLSKPLEISFDALASSDIDHDTLTYKWNFGDGTSGTGITISHLFSSPGNYQVSLMVSDNFSSATISKNVEVKNEEDDSEGNPSSGYLAILPNLEHQINSLNTEVVFTIENAIISSDSSKQVEIFRNGTQIIASGALDNNKLIFKNILESGRNEIFVSTSDSSGKILSGSAVIWAGNNSVSVIPKASVGAQLTPPYSTNVFLADELSVTSAYNVLNPGNLPKTTLVIVVEDALKQIGITIVPENKINSDIIVTLFPPTDLIAIENNDFTSGLSGWSITGGTPAVIPHIETSEPNPSNLDLSVSASSSIRVSKIIQKGIAQRSAWITYKYQSKNANDKVITVFRGTNSGKLFLNVSRPDLTIPISETETENSTGWTQANAMNFLEGEPVEVILSTFPAEQAVSSVKRSQLLKKSRDVIFSQFISEALAASSQASLVIDKIVTGHGCVISKKFIDYSPPPSFFQSQTSDTIEASNFLLYGLSVGQFDINQLGGKNTIAARVKVCGDTSFYNWRIEAYTKTETLVLGKTLGISPPLLHDIKNEYDIVFTLDENALKKISENIPSDEKIKLYLSAYSDSAQSEKFTIYSENFEILIRKVWPEKFRYAPDRGNSVGGDDWMPPWMNDLMTAITNEFENSPEGNIRFNDVANMNGGYFKEPHAGHRDGFNIDIAVRINHPVGGWSESQEAMNAFFKVFKKYGNRVELVFLQHHRPFSDGDGDDSISQLEDIPEEENFKHFNIEEVSFNRLRHECIGNRLMRRVITSVEGHGTHYHFKMRKEAISKTSPGEIELKVSQSEGGVLKFQPEIFKWENNERYEVYFEKEISDGYKEFVPLVPNENPLGNNYGQIKLKALRIKRNGNDYTCSTKFQTTFPEFVRNEEVEYFIVNLNPDGVCNGEYLKPVRGVFGDYPTSMEVGWVSPESVLDKGNIGANAYLCAGSSLKNYSELFGGNNGILEVKNSNISSGTYIYGNIRIDNSNVDHADISGPYIEGPWSPQSKFSVIRFSDIKDLLDEVAEIGYVGPNQIYGLVNLLGSASARVNIDRASLPINAPDSPSGIQGTQILSALQEINILAGAKISNSFISGRYGFDVEGKVLSIGGNTEIFSSSLIGNLSISGTTKISSSGVYGAVDTSGGPENPTRSMARVESENEIEISDASILSSTVRIKGKILGPDTRIENSNIGGKSLIVSGSIVKDSDIGEVQIEGTKLVSCEGGYNFNSKNSLIENSILFNSIINDSKVSNTNQVRDSQVFNNSEISNSAVYSSTVDSSKIINSSNVSESIFSLNSIIDGSLTSRTSISNSRIVNSNSISGGTIVDTEIDSLLPIVNSELFKSTITQSRVTDSVIKESQVSDSDIRNSHLELSIFSNSAYAEESTVNGSEVVDAQLRPLSKIQNSKVLNKSTITDSVISNGSTIDYSDVDSKSEVDNSLVTGMPGTYRSGIRNSKVKNYSEVNYSYVENSSLNMTRAIASLLGSDTITNSTMVEVSFNGKNITNSYCYKKLDPLGIPTYECIAGTGPTVPGGPKLP